MFVAVYVYKRMVQIQQKARHHANDPTVVNGSYADWILESKRQYNSIVRPHTFGPVRKKKKKSNIRTTQRYRIFSEI